MQELLIIALLIVVITDLSDFWDNVGATVWKTIVKDKPYPKGADWTKVHPMLKIFRCSFCQVWWVTLISSIIMGICSIYTVAYCMLLAFFTPVMKDMLLLARDIATKIIEGLYRLFRL